MPITVDDRPLAADELGLQTLGQVLAHVQKDQRLITQLLIDGQPPELDELPRLRLAPLNGKTIYIETTPPGQMAIEVLDEVEQQLDQADEDCRRITGLLAAGQSAAALQRLGGCFRAWQNAQESIVKVAQLLRIDLQAMHLEGRSVMTILHDFAEQLRLIKSALENRDFVSLSDTLNYETSQTVANWRAVICMMRNRAESL